MTRALRLPLVIVAILLGIGTAVFLRVGADSKPHSVLLKWVPPPPEPAGAAVKYNIYRSEPDAPYLRIASGVPSPTYIDHDVSSGKTYYYVVKTVDSAGRESSPSNQVLAKVP